MTLIAALEVAGCFVAIGDALTTRQSPPSVDSKIEILSLGKINAKLVGLAQNEIVGLAQKIQIIEEQVIFGWSGLAYQAFSIANALRCKLKEARISKSVFDEILAEIPVNERNDVGFFIAFAEDGAIRCYRNGMNAVPDTKYAKHIACAGSGLTFFSELIAQVDQGIDSRVTGTLNQMDLAITVGLQIASSAHCLETLSAHCPRDGWGCAYEVATFVGGKPKKKSAQFFI